MGMRIIPYTEADTATLYCVPSPVYGMEEDALQNSLRGNIMRVLADYLEIDVEFASAKRIGGVVLNHHNLRVGDRVRIELFDSTNLSSNIYDSGWVDAIPAKTLGELDWGIDNLGAGIEGVDYTQVLFDPLVCESMRVSVDASGISYIDICRLFAGPCPTEASIAYGYLSRLGTTRNRTEKWYRTASGSLQVEKLSEYRRLNLTVSFYTDNEYSKWDDLFRRGDEIWISARDDARGRANSSNALLCRVTSEKPSVEVEETTFSLNVTVEEV